MAIFALLLRALRTLLPVISLILLLWGPPLSFSPPSSSSAPSSRCHPPALLPPFLKPHSAHRCLHRHLGTKGARCRFRNVCVDANGTMLYFDPQGTAEDYLREPRPFAWLHKDPLGKVPLKLKLVNGEPPQNANWSPHPAVLFHPFHPVNFGHALDDDFFGAFRLLRPFGLQHNRDMIFLTDDTRIDECAPVHERGREADRTHCKHLRSLGAFFGKGTWSVAHPPEWLATNNNGEQLVCLRDLFAGSAGLAMHLDTESLHDEFIAETLCRADLDPNPPLPNPRRVAIYTKTGRRRTLNDVSIRDALVSQLNLPVDMLDVASLDFPGQLAAMQKYALVITPAGGLSFSTSFLPPRAAFIVIGSWNTILNSSSRMDEVVFSPRTRVRDLYYDPPKHEVRVNWTMVNEVTQGGVVKLTEWQIWRNYGDVEVDVERMVGMVKRALEEMEEGWR